MTCDRCGMAFRPGEPAWRVRLSLTADTEQGLSEYDGLPARQLDDRLEALLARIEMIPQEMLENQVYQEFLFVVCSRCRGILAANPLQQPLDATGVE